MSYNPYQRPEGGNSTFGNETYVPGMQQNAPGVTNQVNSEGVKGDDKNPVVGFLYSISRKGIGEFWPLHLGPNTIGRSSENDIQLLEASVSDKHASLSVRKMKTTGNLIASVQDSGSKNGMFLNDEELDFERHTCKNGDVLTIGSCYKLVLLLIDANAYGLSVAEDFVPVDEEQVDEPNRPNGLSFYERGERADYGGTVDLSGNNITEPGGTQFM